MLTRAEIDYDDAAFHYACQDLTVSPVEPFARLAYEISADKTLSTREVRRLTIMVANLAVAVVVLNIDEAEGTPELVAAALDANQKLDATR